MGTDPEESVCDSYGRTHDHENLFVGRFPDDARRRIPPTESLTSGCFKPTFGSEDGRDAELVHAITTWVTLATAVHRQNCSAHEIKDLRSA